MELLGVFIVTILLREIYAGIPILSRWLVDRAICRMHAEMRDRWTYELYFQLNALPNTIYGLVHAFSIYFHVDRFNADFVAEKCGEIDDLIAQFTARHREYVEKLRAVKLEHARPRGAAYTNGGVSLSKAASLPKGTAKSEFAKEFEKAARAIEKLFIGLIQKTNRAWDLTGVMTDCLAARCDHVDGLFRIVSAKRAQAEEFLHKKYVAPDVVAPLLRSMTDDLGVIKNIFENDEYKWDDAFEVSCSEHEKIMAALGRATSNIPTTDRPTLPTITADVLVRIRKLK